MSTSVPGIYAVGDVIGPPWLAHVAHHEAVCCIERLCGFADRTVDYTNIPGCTYTDPGVASVGLTEKAAREAGHEVRIGKFPFQFSGRALASDETEGFVKLVFDAKYGELLGAHLIGSQATELIAELVMAKKLEATEEEILHAMHPHPTYSEADHGSRRPGAGRVGAYLTGSSSAHLAMKGQGTIDSRPAISDRALAVRVYDALNPPVANARISVLVSPNEQTPRSRRVIKASASPRTLTTADRQYASMSFPLRNLPLMQNWACHSCSDCCRIEAVITDEEKHRIEALDLANDPEVAPKPWFAPAGSGLQEMEADTSA